jgi:Ca2+-binding RTX toxin-like protein
MVRRILLLLLPLGMVCPGAVASAQAGVLTLMYACGHVSGPGVYGVECTPAAVYGAEYRADSGEASRITLSDLPGGGLLLRDAGAAVSVSRGGCTLVDTHSAICPRIDWGAVVWGGDEGDVIDARRWTGVAIIHGGSGNDTLQAGSGATEVSGGGGRNTIVGRPQTVVSYEDAKGPVQVDLAKGIGTMPGERDRLLAVRNVLGSDVQPNRLSGSWAAGGSLAGGRGSNLLVARGPATMLSAGGPGVAPTTFVCSRETEVVYPEVDDVVVGDCRVDQLVLRPDLNRAAAAFLAVPTAKLHNGEEEGYASEITARVSSGAIVARVRPSTQSARLLMRLNRLGRKLLSKAGRLRVHVQESWRLIEGGFGASTQLAPPEELLSFTTVLRVRH